VKGRQAEPKSLRSSGRILHNFFHFSRRSTFESSDSRVIGELLINSGGFFMSYRMLLAGACLFALSACSQKATHVEDGADSASEAARQTAETVGGSANEAAETIAEGVDDAVTAVEDALCLASGPQAPRDITFLAGTNPVSFPLAPASTQMNLCNIHTHTHAEHKAPGFSIKAVPNGDPGHEGIGAGYQCNETPSLTEAELANPFPDGEAPFKLANPGDTIEVHWVHTSCEATPGKGLGSCVPQGCENPLLRVEAQSFLLVNDPAALDFAEFAYGGNVVNGLHQPKAIPSNTGEPVVFLGSTTGPSYDERQCSPFQVTWSVRPTCAKLDINSLHAWAAGGNVFEEAQSHGVRELVTAPQLLSPIE
jgi:hypothetical protein